ncbi:hypothetical protein KOI35_23515 [Actinoplanes bogorensis]|uniref:DUF192 domain-containing protein n=1 Tax=Paractinoplanes bogorensis TaxID=1610840 RepID=A0ABS5YSP9_9ACTN|nr:hypothetical protein [Actinoplanes bogorensis]MBU2666479.1 hypothetical protein [Actinoplanes bogorensis]
MLGLVLLIGLIGFGVLGTWHPVPGLAGAIAVLLGALVTVLIAPVRRRFGLGRWARANGWTAVAASSRPWPWDGLALSGRVEPGRAWKRPGVTFGEVRWSGGALTGAVAGRDGHGLFVVLNLPEPHPGMAMRLPDIVVGDAPELARPGLREAFRAGEIPPWTLRADELFTVEAGAVRPATVERAVVRARSVARHLDLLP